MTRPGIDWKGRFRRNPVVAARSDKRPLIEPTADAQPWRRERVLMPLLSGPCCYRTPAAGFCCYGLGVVTRTVLRIAKAAGVKLTRGRPCRNRPPCWAPRASLTSSPVGSSDPGPAHRRHPPDLPPPVRLRRDVCKMRRAGFGWDQRCLHRREHYPRRSPPTAGNQANRGIRQDTLANTGWRSNSPGALRLRPCAG